MPFKQVATWQVHDEIGRRKYVNANERRRFLEAVAHLDEAERALCTTLAYTGCRISEALALHIHQVDTDAMTLTFKTLKRRRTVFRVIPIPEELVIALHALPVAEDGRLWHIHRTTAWRLVKKVMDLAAIAGPMASCKGLRHGFGIRAADHSIPPNLIQRWMGHASSTTTAIYMDAVGIDERNFAAKLWP